MVAEIGVLENVGIVLNDSSDEREVAEVDGAAEADGDINPGRRMSTYHRAGIGSLGLTLLLFHSPWKADD